MSANKQTSRESTAQFESRKKDHIQFALADKNQTRELCQLSQIRLRHEALPELNFNDITLETQRLGKTVKSPFLISSMTAGHNQAAPLNESMAIACAELGWAMGVGSQRRQLFDRSSDNEWKTIRKLAPEVDFYGNLGIAQLIQTDIDNIKRLIDSLQASAMIIHCNPLQECLQTEGTPQFKGGLKAIADLCEKINTPVIVKETGCGFSHDTLKRLNNIGIAAVDISGLGGTHWGRIEGDRATEQDWQHQAAVTFKAWGITTVESLQAAKIINSDYEVWGSGGVRSGLDAAKLLALGASAIGIAKPILAAALQGPETLIQCMQAFENELKTALFCTGCDNISALQKDKICL